VYDAAVAVILAPKLHSPL